MRWMSSWRSPMRKRGSCRHTGPSCRRRSSRRSATWWKRCGSACSIRFVKATAPGTCWSAAFSRASCAHGTIRTNSCMTPPRACGRTTTSWVRMLSRKAASCRRGGVLRFALACVCSLAAVAPALGQSGSSLADLIRVGNRKAALDRIRTGADVNEAQPDGTRPIHWAVYKVDYDLIDALIAKKATVDVANEFGSTPLAEAVKLADARMVKMLLDAGAGVDRADESGQTALMLAIKTGELPIVEMLVKAGANVNTVEKFQNQRPLMWAVVAPKNAAEMTKLLLSKGADVKPRALYTCLLYTSPSP